jgi:hypothetical protein
VRALLGVDSGFALVVFGDPSWVEFVPNLRRDRWKSGRKSKPRMSLVLAVLIAKMRFEDARFGARASNLQDEHWNKKQEQKRAFEEEKKSCKDEGAKYIDGIANARIDAVGDQLSRLGPDREGIAKLDACGDQEN